MNDKNELSENARVMYAHLMGYCADLEHGDYNPDKIAELRQMLETVRMFEKQVVIPLLGHDEEAAEIFNIEKLADSSPFLPIGSHVLDLIEAIEHVLKWYDARTNSEQPTTPTPPF